MGKKYMVRTIQIPEKGTILEKFHEYLKTHKKKRDVIDFLSCMNAQLLGQLRVAQMNGHSISGQLAEEIVEFAEYFDENFYDIMYNDMMDQWGQDPLILRLAETIMYEQYCMERKEFIENAPDFVKKEAQTLTDTLFSIREERNLTFVYELDGETISGTYFLPKRIPKNELQDAREELLYVCTVIVSYAGAITVRLMKKDHMEVFGVRIYPNHIWSPVGKEEMRKASLITPDGIELEPEEGVIYTEIQRQRF